MFVHQVSSRFHDCIWYDYDKAKYKSLLQFLSIVLFVLDLFVGDDARSVTDC